MELLPRFSFFSSSSLFFSVLCSRQVSSWTSPLLFLLFVVFLHSFRRLCSLLLSQSVSTQSTMKISFVSPSLSPSSSSFPSSPLSSSSSSLRTSPSTQPFSPSSSSFSPRLLQSPVLVLSLSELIEGILPFRFHFHLKLLPSSSVLLRQQLLLPSLHLLALQQDLLYRFQHDLLTLEKQNAPEDTKRKESPREENQQVHERLLRLVRRTLSGLLPPILYHHTLTEAYEDKGGTEKSSLDFLPSLSLSERNALDLFASQNACKVSNRARGESPCLTLSPHSDEDRHRTSRESSQTRRFASSSSSSLLRSPSSSSSFEESNATPSNSCLLSSSSSLPLIFSWMPSTVAAYGAITARYLPTSSEVLPFNDLFNLKDLSQSLLLPSTTTFTLEKYERTLSRRHRRKTRKSEDKEDRLSPPLEDIVLYSDKRGINSSLSPYRRKHAEASPSNNPDGRSISLQRERSDRGRLQEREEDSLGRREEEDMREMTRPHDNQISREGAYEDEREREGEEPSYLDEDERRKNRKREREIEATKIIVSDAESRRRRRLV